MKGLRKVAAGLVSCVVTASLCIGCGAAPQQAKDAPRTLPVSMESTPVLDYTAPVLTPNIMVNQSGYQTGGNNTAFLKGEKLPESFRVIESGSGDVVYTDSIEQAVFDEELGVYTGFADFGDFLGSREEMYYLECDYIGKSYTFSIRPDGYRRLFLSLYTEICRDCESEEVSLNDVIALLVAFERYSQIFPDENGDEVPDVMKVVREWTARLDYGQLDADQGSLYAACLAKFSYLYQKYDIDYATECLQLASTAFAQSQGTLQKDAESFFALTELYRATGLYTYRNQILDYKTFFQSGSSLMEENGYLDGAMTYMVTRQRVDVELCRLFMDALITRGEEISRRHDEMISPVDARNNGADDLLRQAEQIACANYVLNSYQYDWVLEEILHYLMGCNLESVSFYPGESRSSYLTLLARLAWVKEYETASGT